MPPKSKGKAAAQTSTLVAHNFLPQLAKPQSIKGEFIAMEGQSRRDIIVFARGDLWALIRFQRVEKCNC